MKSRWNKEHVRIHKSSMGLSAARMKVIDRHPDHAHVFDQRSALGYWRFVVLYPKKD